MNLPSILSTEKLLIGNDAGWHLAFFQETDLDNATCEFGSEDYYADIRATLSGDLSGGNYLFTIEGLTDSDYAQISQSTGTGPKVVKLYLYWRDTNSNAANYLKNLAGLTDTLGKLKSTDLKDNLVAVLHVLSVTRKAGTRRYEITIKASERVFEVLSVIRLCKPIPGKDTEAAVKELLRSDVLQQTKDLAYTFYPPKAAAASAQASSPEEKKSPVKEKREFGGGSTPLELLRNIGTSLEKTTNLNGRGMLLVRDGELHIGPRPIPLQGDPKELRLSNGLIETEAAEPYKTDQNFNPCSDANVDTGPVSSSSKAPTRKQFKLTLKGRPDIKPGDVVVVDVPKEDAPQTPGGGLLGAIGDLVSSSPLLPSLGDGDFKYPAYLYVNSVEHVLGRASGFATTVYGIQIAEKKKPDPQAEESWDKFSALGQKKPDADPPHTSADMQAAHAVRNLAQDLVNGRVFPEVGEVRAMTPKSQGEDLSQTLKLDIGLAPGQGKLNEASRLAIQHPSLTSGSDIPYLTPFAWGKCGLVLPRYPGTRVLVNYHNGNPDDPIEAGSFWEAERGPDSELGDWWLILPVGASTGEPAEDKSPDEHNGPVTHDLIDAKGNRVIEVGELTIRIGDLKSMSEQPRPKRSDDEQAITLEHTAGSKIVMDKDGNITITAAKDITLDASNGTITMKAQDVKVKVDNAMDIS